MQTDVMRSEEKVNPADTAEFVDNFVQHSIERATGPSKVGSAEHE